MPVVNDRVLDRVPEFDEKSRDYPIRALIRGATDAATPKPLRSYTWACSTYLDQGQEGACVGHGVAHEAAAQPLPRPVTSEDAFSIYRQAQKIDEWPGEAYSGTSTLAGMKVATSLGWYSEYRWAFGLEDVVLALGYKGPVVIGVNWYEGMFDTDAKGYIRATGALSGGHCTLLRGVTLSFVDIRAPRTLLNVDLDRSYVLVHNSWGRAWGKNGTARLSLRDLDRLLREQGDACVPVVRK